MSDLIAIINFEIGRNNMPLRVLLLFGIVALAMSQSSLQALLPEIEGVIAKARSNLWAEIEPDEPIWNMLPWLGTQFISEYYFMLKALQLQEPLPFPSRLDTVFFTQKLLREQLPDGSWKQIVDQNRKTGSLDATIFNYWFLKEAGVEEMSATMSKARKFILNQGGLEKAQMMTKYKLAAFGQFEWSQVNYIPLFLMKNNSFPFYSYGYIKNYVAQWVYPHLIGLAYMRYQKTIFPVSKVCLTELMTSRGHLPCETSTNQHLLKSFPLLNNSRLLQRDDDVDNLLEEIIKLYRPKGTVGGYSVSTLLSLMCFKDYSLRYTSSNNELIEFYRQHLNQSLSFIEELYFNRRVPYEGSLDDGRYWDTILAVFALLQAGQNPLKLHPTLQFLVKNAVQPSGGIPYGLDFEYAPDVDDTALLLTLYGKMKEHFKGTQLGHFYEKQARRSYQWMKKYQNKDGGFPAFDKDKNDGQYKMVSFAFWVVRIDQSAEIFDPSCPDITGHLLEGMAEAGVADPEVVHRSMEYLMESRKDGMWSARWGINYVYGVGAVFPGLASIGYDMREEWVQNVTRRLQQVQQEDGGFGEDHESYNIRKYKKGVTTASMTAWGLMAYLEVAHTMPLDVNIRQAARYLIDNFKKNGDKFYDRSVVGTGHRGILNLQYPIYAYSFPLVALSRLRAYIKGREPRPFDEELMRRMKRAQKAKEDEL